MKSQVTITLDDPELGERTLDANDHAGLIADQLRLLQSFQRKGNKTQELKDDIEFYQYILADADPQKKSNEYLEAKHRFRMGGIPFSYNHGVGDLLGWVWRKQ